MISHSPFFQNFTLFLLLFLFFFSSCSHKYYAPNDGEFLVLTKRNDLHVSQSINGGNLTSTSTQLGFSPVKHLGLTGSFFKIKGERNNPSDNTFQRKGDGTIWNTAVGGYYPFLFDANNDVTSLFDESQQSGVLADIYFGYGKGEVNNYYEIGGSTHFKFDKKYVQLGAHLILEKVNVGYQFRLGRLNYSEGKILGQATSLTMESFNSLNEKNNFKIIEQAFQFSYGIRHFRIQFTSTGVVNNKNLNKLGIKRTNTTIGIILEIDEFFRKDKSIIIEKKRRSSDFKKM
ncbi:MAG: hypothetical protein AB8H03_07830 [Saprospiraceae bacterium]